MIAVNHALTGGVIALAIKEPAIALPLALLSHFAVDYIPHWSMNPKYAFKRKFNIYLTLDTLICILLAVLSVIYLPNGLLVAVCMFLAASPDFMWAYHRLYREKIKGLKRDYGPIAKFHSAIQESSHYRHGKRGLIIELMWFISMACAIIILR